MGTAFTYQGHLYDANHVANDIYDFQFKLFDAVTDGNQIGNTVSMPDVDVIDGYFTVVLDFNNINAFNGENRWLDIGIRPGEQNDPCEYTVLIPRQELTPTPYALYSLQTTGLSVITDNTFVGLDAGTNNTSGYANAFLGYQAGYSNTTGHLNTFLGLRTGYSNTTGSYNTFLGYQAGLNNTEAHYSTFLGSEAGYNTTTGLGNTFLGHRAGYFNTTGEGNVFLGLMAGYFTTTGHHNAFLGNFAGNSNTTGFYNMFSGFKAGYSNTTGNSNTFSGSMAGYSNTTGIENTFIGYQAGNQGTDSWRNTYLGYQAGYNTTGDRNVFIGYQAGKEVGYGHNLLYIENTNSSSPLIYGEFNNDLVAINGKLGIETMSPQRTLDVNDVMRLQPRATAPSAPAEGDIYMDSTDHKLKVYDGTAWRACW
ncbi:MAG: hypothetical protein ABIG61_12965 [Planctomycetota bacterium]